MTNPNTIRILGETTTKAVEFGGDMKTIDKKARKPIAQIESLIIPNALITINATKIGKSTLTKSNDQPDQKVTPLVAVMTTNRRNDDERMQRRGRIGLFRVKENTRGDVNGFRKRGVQNGEAQINNLAVMTSNGMMKMKTLLNP
ncbi:4812_t:CDS:2 [Entrophospora sp. SA101]|nr:4812_t:CDS:2 [Entrophospora sp. SA101]CAJ0829691.1 9300_t:CDS:2 [Entrophospora sp. SA101]